MYSVRSVRGSNGGVSPELIYVNFSANCSEPFRIVGVPENQEKQVSHETRAELLRRILASSHFAHAESLRRILQFLCDRSQDADEGRLKEYEIAVDAMFRPHSFDPKLDPIVRVSIAGIRDRLRAYFENEGRAETLRLTIPKGQYRVFYERAEGSVPAGSSNPESRFKYRKQFWQPYIGKGPNLLIYTELLFFRDDNGNYVRNIYENEIAAGPAAIARHLNASGLEKFRPSFHFISAGEVHSLLSIVSSFHEMGEHIQVYNSRFVSWPDLRKGNVVLLGSARTNPFLHSLQGNESFLMTLDSIQNKAPQSHEQPAYTGRRYFDGNLERLVEYAVITRRSGPLGQGSVTLIAGNHGRAIEGAGHFLAREDKLQGMLQQMCVGEAAKIPEHFQVILQVDMIDFDEEVIDVQYITHRTIASASTT